MQSTMNKTPFVPQTGFVFPQQPDEPFLKPEKTRELDIENNYPFLDRSFAGRFNNFIIYTAIFAVVFKLNTIRYGIKIKGKENLRKSRRLFKNGAMTICNHVYRWDFLAVLQAVKWRRIWFPARKANLETSDAYLIRGAGGIPIPQTNAAAIKFNRAFDTLHKEKKWIHVFPESCRWDFYQPIRPFKMGAFKMAARYKIPIIPMAISYRKPTGLYKLWNKTALITLNIGEPILTEKPEGIGRNEFCEELCKKAHRTVCELAGIENNIWPAFTEE
ncbi:MAG: 1-acyl-sn-glycerol-3-phosphate acyltransferase [Treponema sp.]|nr:1-acyl-sn-glycerol-3-phosphate acyltransferase [Candidatus Treponema equifaecale]